MNVRKAQEVIQRIAAADDGRIFSKIHAQFRKPEAGKHPLTKQEIVAVLASGVIDEGPSQDIVLADGWKFRMKKSYDDHTYNRSASSFEKARLWS